MTLANVAYLAEIIGVIGLIASLIYVGKQLQLNREQLRADAESRYYAWVDQAFSRIALDRAFAEVWNRGNALHELDEVDRERLINHEIGALYMWQQFHWMMERGALPHHSKDALEWALKGVGSRQAMREAWRVAKPGFAPSFQERLSPYLD